MTTDTVSIANPTLALLSESTFVINRESRPGVITVQRWENDHIEITIQPLAQLPYPIDIEVIIDSDDLASIKRLLDAQDAARAATYPSYPSYPSKQSDHSKRLDALEAHAVETDDTLSILRGRIDNNGDALASRLAYVERTLEGRTGPEAGL